MNTLTDIRSGVKESPFEYMKKVFKITGYALSVNRVFIILMLVASLLVLVINFNAGGTHTAMESFIIVPAGLGLFMPLIMFQHMFKRGEFDFYAAMPIKRTRYFWGFSLAAVTGFLMIYLFVFAVLALTNFHQSFRYFLPGLAMFFAVFSSALLAVMLSRSYFVFFLIFIVLNAFVFETLSILPSIIDVNQPLYAFAFRKIIYFFTPLYTALLYMDDSAGMLGLIPLIMAVIEFAAAFFLHRIRGNEGYSSLAFSKIRYPLQYIIMFMAAFLLCTGFVVFHFVGTEERSMGMYLNEVFRDSSFIPYTLIVILITFIMSNMIFENTPRGVFRKIYHLFIFTAGYGVFFIVIIGGIIFPGAPQNFVPFDSNAVIVMAQSYESRTATEYNAVYNAWQKALNDVYDYVEANFRDSYYNYAYDDKDPEYQRLERISQEASKEFDRWKQYDYDGEYYLRSTGVTLYLITDKEYIDYLGKGVKEKGNMQNYVGWEFGYQGIVSEPAVSIEENAGAEARFPFEYYYDNATVLSIRFFDISEEALSRLKSNFKEEGYDAMYTHFYDDDGGHKFDFRTFVDTEEALKGFESHTAESFFLDGLIVDYDNFNPSSVY